MLGRSVDGELGLRRTEEDVGERTFDRSGYIQLLYGSSAKACCMVSIAPSMSASVIRVTWIGIMDLSEVTWNAKRLRVIYKVFRERGIEQLSKQVLEDESIEVWPY